MGKREIEMIETITINKFPDEFSVTYEAKGVWNEVQNYFTEVDENLTRWKSVNVFKCVGFMKVMAFFMPGMFKKESCKYLKNFKAFAESK